MPGSSEDASLKSVAALESAIMEYLTHHNADPKTSIWTKSASQILEKVDGAKQALKSQHWQGVLI